MEVDDIVISGVSGRYPNSDNLDEFWENLISGTDMITDEGRRWPAGMYGLPTRAGLLKDIASFDATFFSVSAKQADKMDPQLRLLLEVCYETILDSGYHPHELRGKKVAVYVGASSSEAYDALTTDSETQTGYGLLGCCRNMLANRIAFTFDFKGPSYTLDTACSSSLFALDAGIKAMKLGECDMVLAAGVNILLKPNTSVDFNKLSMLSSDGSCKVFDEKANGYVRAETVSAVMLCKANVARRAYAKVLGSGTNTDGHKSKGITYPSHIAQSDLLFDIYRQACIAPTDVYYVEMHGTGTQAGDLQEMLGVERFFLSEPRKKPLLVGSVKSNMGHSEPSSGVAALTKLLLAFYYKKIPANINFDTANDKLTPIIDGRVVPVTKHVELERSSIVGLNSFGFGGANAHIILQGIENVESNREVCSEIPILLPHFGRLQTQISSSLLKLRDDYMTNNKLSYIHLTCQGASTDASRRGYVILNGVKRDPVVSDIPTDLKRPLWFVMTGMGAQWRSMGKDMMRYESFRNSIECCTRALKSVPDCEIDVKLLVTDPEADLETPENAFVALCAIQIGLIDLLTKFDIKADGIVGHSVGELVCGYTDGCLTIHQTILAAYFRGKCIRDADLAPGAMAAVGITWDEAVKVCEEHGQGVVAACHNNKESVTISGDKEAVEDIVTKLKERSVFAKMVNSCGVAFHSPSLADIGPQLSNCLKPIIPNPKKRSEGWVCTSRKEVDWYKAEYCDAEYLSNNLVSPVRFYNSLKHIPEKAIVVEVAACGLLQGILRQSLPQCTVLSLMKRNDPKCVEFFLNTIGKMWNLGVNPKFGEFYKPSSHPMVDVPPMSSMVSWDHSTQYATPSYLDFGAGSGSVSQVSYVFKVDTSDKANSYHTMSGHMIDGRNLLPATGYLYFVWKAVALSQHNVIEQQPVELTDVKLHQATILKKGEVSSLTVTLSRGKEAFEVTSGDTLVVSGSYSTNVVLEDVTVEVADESVKLDTDSVYTEFRLRGYEYKDIYQGIMSADSSGTFGVLNWQDDWVSFMDTMLQVQLIRFKQRGLRLPTRISKVVIDPKENMDTVGGVNFIFNPLTNQCKAGGVLIEGLHTTMAQRRSDHKEVLFEKHVFIPYYNETTSHDHSLRLLLDICQDNISNANALSVCEYGTRDLEAVCDKVLNSNPGRPLCQYTACHRTAQDDTVTVWDLEKDKSSTVFDIIIYTPDHADLTPQSVGSLINSLSQEGFIILRADKTDTAIRSAFMQYLVEVSRSICSNTQFSLLRHKTQAPSDNAVKVVEITNTPSDWVSTLQSLANDSADYRIWLIGKYDTGVLGLCNALRREDCGAKIRCVLSDVSLSRDEFRSVISRDLVVNVHREKVWGSYRYFALPKVGTSVQPTTTSEATKTLAYVDTIVRGDLSSLSWISAPLPELSRHSLMCKVEFASLNFRDVMIATGKLPPDALPMELQGSNDCVLGLEFSGIRAESGSKVMGILPVKALATAVITKEAFVWDVPESWTLEEASSVPVVYCTAYYSLIVRGGLKHRHSVLIHSGSGGVGQAAISIALSMDCEVFTTCGSQQKVEFLMERFPSLKEDHILNSRSTQFEKDIMNLTKSRGVDVVLNSLAGDKLQASLRCVARHGRFLEIGKYDLSENNPIGLSVFLRNIAFHGILLDALFEGSNEDWLEVRSLFDEGVKNGVVKPLPVTVFQNTELEKAFRFMAQGRHIGKVVISTKDSNSNPPKTIVPKFSCKHNKSYLVTGGLGGFGLELIQWLSDKGAMSIIVTSRSGVKTSYQKWILDRLASKGVQVTVNSSDTTTLEGVRSLITASQPPVDGIFHLAGVLRDGLLENLDEKMFEDVFMPKVYTAQYLDVISRELCPDLETFVCFSSVVSGRGNSGQSNYAAANSVLERLCEKRAWDGLPGVAVQWGAIGDVGMAYKMVGNDANIGGTYPQRIWNCLNTLESSLNTPNPVVSSIVLADKGNGQAQTSDADLVTAIANVLGASDPSKLDSNTSLEDMGLDSLMSVEVKQALDRAGHQLSSKDISALTLTDVMNLQNKAASDDQPTLNIPEIDRTVTELKRVDGTVPMYLVHPITLDIQPLLNLAKHLNCTVFGVQFTKEANPDSSVEDLALFYSEHILEQSKTEKVNNIRLGGYSFGALLAFEIAIILQQKEDVALQYLAFIDGSPFWIAHQIDSGKESTLDKSCQAIMHYMSSYMGVTVTQDTYDQLLPYSYNIEKQSQVAIDIIKKHHPTLKISDNTMWRMCNSTRLLISAEKYRPQSVLNHNIHLIRAAAEVKGNSDDYGIGKITEGILTVEHVSGNHYTCVYDYSDKTALLIQKQLDNL